MLSWAPHEDGMRKMENLLGSHTAGGWRRMPEDKISVQIPLLLQHLSVAIQINEEYVHTVQ